MYCGIDLREVSVRRGTLALAVLIILIIGGYFALQIIANAPESALPVRIQTDNPEASVVAATQEQALAFVLFSLCGIGSLIGGGTALALGVRWLDRQIARNKHEQDPWPPRPTPHENHF
jgi:hypothetical protein